MSKSHHSSSSVRPTEEAIAKRAYEISLQRGSLPGHEVEDWLQAEAELIAAATAAEQTQSASVAEADEDAANGRSPTVRRGAGRRESAPAPTRRSLRQ